MSVYSVNELYQENNPSDYLKAIVQFRRILRKDGKCFITLPFGKNVNLGWLQIFDMDMVKGIIDAFDPTLQKTTFFKYSSEGWQLSTEGECADCGYAQNYPGDDMCPAAYAVACIELTR